MKKGVAERLHSEIMEDLNGKSLVNVQAYDKEEDTIISSAVSWVYAIDDQTIRFAIDHKSVLARLAEAETEMVLSLVSGEAAYSIYGKPKLKVAKTEGLSLKLALIEVEVADVRNTTFYGAKIVQKPAFVKTYDEKLVIKLDTEVSEAIKSL
ncbi:hypothetical protein [Alkalihalobacterium alkalinitrilicum]|uniref:hypothetical protein n=1 Tax=Alkalihalobacterium alkalinitrilicum TaxID=427920 RepID=UPI000995A097|nr:hypothetical protein [Alkalihalobacterium alkalinitrilicum]